MVHYDFKSLSPLDFEILVRDLLQSERGIIFESFKPGRDGGVDLRHSLSPDRSIVVQAKHYAESGAGKLISHLRKIEAPKIQKIRPHEYILTTSASLSPEDKKSLHEIIAQCGVGIVCVYGREDLNNLLSRHEKVERLHHKLWLSSSRMLDFAINKDLLNQTEFKLEEIQFKAKRYVNHDGFYKAIDILQEQRVCILSGQPGIGKTTLAEMLLVYYVSLEYVPRVINSDIRDAFRQDISDPDKKYIYYYDDFLGQASLQEKSLKEEESSLIQFIETIGRRKKDLFILTTREYILREALALSEKLNSAGIQIIKYVLDLTDYTKLNRAHILYNHLFFSSLPQGYIDQLLDQDFYLKIIKHRNYNPRVIEGMTTSLNFGSVRAEEYPNAFLAALDNPTKLWENAYSNHISDDSRLVLQILCTLGGQATITDLERAWLYATERQDLPLSRGVGAVSRFKSAVNLIENSFITLGQARVRFTLMNVIHLSPQIGRSEPIVRSIEA